MSGVFNGECHKETFVEVLFHAVIGLMPLAAVVVMFLFGRWEGLGFFWENGEFYIYSVVFSTMAFYKLFNIGLKKDNLGNLLVTFIILSIIVSVILYGALIYTKITQDGILPVESFLSKSSLVLLGLSILFFYIATYWGKYRDFVIQKNSDLTGIENIKKGIN